MLHGTGIEAVAYLFQYGVLPPGRANRFPAICFSPVKAEFKGTAIYSKLQNTCTIQEALNMSRFYAKINSIKLYFRYALNGGRELTSAQGDWLCELENCDSYTELEKMLDQKQLRLFLSDFGLDNYEQRGLRKFVDEGLRRKGVIIETDRKILQMRYGTLRNTDADEIWVKCPQGLPIQYIIAIVPCSEFDAELLKPHLKQL